MASPAAKLKDVKAEIIATLMTSLKEVLDKKPDLFGADAEVKEGRHISLSIPGHKTRYRVIVRKEEPKKAARKNTEKKREAS